MPPSVPTNQYPVPARLLAPDSMGAFKARARASPNDFVLYGPTMLFAYVSQKPSPVGEEKPPVARLPQVFAAAGAAGTATNAEHASTPTRIALRARIVARLC